MSMYKTFKMDVEAEAKGRIIEYDGSFRVTIARAGGSNTRFKKMMEEKMRPYKRALGLEAMTNDLANDLLVDVYAETVIVDWEVKNGDGVWNHGIEAEDGSTLPVTPENIAMTFRNLPDLFQDIIKQSQSGALFRASLREEAEGNL